MTSETEVQPRPNPYITDEDSAEVMRMSVLAAIPTFGLLVRDPSLQAAAIIEWLEAVGERDADETAGLIWEMTTVVQQNLAKGLVIPVSQPHPVCACPVDHQAAADQFNEFVEFSRLGEHEKVIEATKLVDSDDIYPHLGGWIIRLGDAVMRYPITR